MTDYVNGCSLVRTGSGPWRAANGIGPHSRCGCLLRASRSSTCRPKLSARARVFATGQGRKTDATDAHSTWPWSAPDGRAAADYDERARGAAGARGPPRRLARHRVRIVSQLQQLLAELIPGGASGTCPRPRPRRCWRGPTPRHRRQDPAPDRRRGGRRPGRGRREAEDVRAELKAMVQARGSRLMDLHGVGPVGPPGSSPSRRHRPVPRPKPVRVLDRHRTLDASSGEQSAPALPGREPADEPRAAHHRDRPAPSRHRGRAYYRRKQAAARARWRRCAPSSGGCRTSSTDNWSPTHDPDAAAGRTGPGGHCGASLESSAVDLPPHIGTSDQPLPGPAHRPYRRVSRMRTPPRPRQPGRPRRRAGAVKMERPTGRTTLTATSIDAPSTAPRPQP